MEKEFSLSTFIKKNLFIISLICIAALSALSCFSPFCSQNTTMASSIFYLLIIPGLFLLGYFFVNNKIFKLKEIILFIGAVLAIVSLINSITTVSNYGFFHHLTNASEPIYYYNALRYDITKEAFSLIGFNAQKTSLEYNAFFPVLCCAFIPSLLFFDLKKEKVNFAFSLLIGISGICSLIMIGNLKPLILVAIVCVFSTVYRFLHSNKKATKIINIVTASIFALAVLFYVLTCANVLLGYKFTGFFEKLFVTNPIMRNANKLLAYSLGKDANGEMVNLLGFSGNYIAGTDNKTIAYVNSGIIEVDIVKEAGIFGAILLLLIFAFTYVQINAVMNNKKQDNFSKITILSLFGMFFLYASLKYDGTPLILQDSAEPILRSPIFMVYLLLFGTMFESKKEKKTNEK